MNSVSHDGFVNSGASTNGVAPRSLNWRVVDIVVASVLGVAVSYTHLTLPTILLV